MLVDLKDGRCQSCDSALTIVSVEDACMTVRCIECGEVCQFDFNTLGEFGRTDDAGFMSQKLAETVAKTEANALMPANIAVRIPPLNATEEEADPIAWVKYLSPGGSREWFVTEFDPKEQLCFGLVIDPHTHYDAQICWDGGDHAVVLARGDQRRDGQLRCRHRAMPARGRAMWRCAIW